MTIEQKCEFEQRCMEVHRKHLANDPKFRAMRRKRRLGILVSVTGSMLGVAFAMVLLKSFVLAHHGPRDYAQIVAPMLEGRADSSLAARLFGIDPVSAEIAALLRPLLLAGSTVAASAPVSATLPDTASRPDGAPEI